MKKFIYLLLIILLVSSCDLMPWNKSKEKDSFINTYKEILITREMYPDTSIANGKVKSVLAKNGYSMESFKQTYFKYASDHEEFLKMLDTARSRATREYMQLKTKK